RLCAVSRQAVSWAVLPGSLRGPSTRRHDETERIVRASPGLRVTACTAFLILGNACSDSAVVTEPLPVLPDPLPAEEIRERGLGAWKKYHMAHTAVEPALAM